MIEVEHLSKVYGSTTAIQDVDFSVQKGEILGFLGPNGAGKTTTMRILAGYIPATTGTVRVAGFDVHEQSLAVRKRIGYLPENPPLYGDMTVESFLRFVASIKGVTPGDRRQRVDWAIERCQLTEKRKVLIRKLSKGFKQRVGIAQAIVHDPAVIILDEPTVGLDPKQIIEVRNLIKSLAQDHTIILSTHILPEVSMTCDRVTIINQGRVVATNTPDNLLADLRGNLSYQLEVAGAEGTAIAACLGSLAGVGEVQTKIHPQQQERWQVLVRSDRPEELGQQLAQAIVGQGWHLYEMQRLRPTLEDVFLNLITNEGIEEAEEQREFSPGNGDNGGAQA
ncbi:MULTISPECIES: ABC transporter ATP-binding protein [unclassified Synechocystis]|uniref:ABC transporter ATP-binding protein n=1 Tax=unclassified Synechocystis TaxID=2640012 RepID=UPI00041CB09D|nr:MULTISPECIES: ABC transporter ATP-binding protein [unclassified Synechocystis]MCT0252453.1 ABC transporter ATP-binding protein [Synechocystis sp. CS-94]